MSKRSVHVSKRLAGGSLPAPCGIRIPVASLRATHRTNTAFGFGWSALSALPARESAAFTCDPFATIEKFTAPKNVGALTSLTPGGCKKSAGAAASRNSPPSGSGLGAVRVSSMMDRRIITSPAPAPAISGSEISSLLPEQSPLICISQGASYRSSSSRERLKRRGNSPSPSETEKPLPLAACIMNICTAASAFCRYEKLT